MPIPKSVVKMTKDGVEYTSNVDRCAYYINELVRAALRDSGKYICKMTRKRILRRTGRLAKNTQYWVRKRENDLQVGFKPGGFYGMYQELGSEKQPKIGALTNATYENINTIREIQAQYLSAIEDELKAQSLIDEEETLSDEI